MLRGPVAQLCALLAQVEYRLSARKLFNSVSEADVRYDAVDSYESLLELVRG